MNKIFLELGPISIHWYAIIILLGILVAYLIVTLEARRQKLDQNFISDLLFYAIPIGIIGARLYYVIFNFQEYQNNLIDIIKIWEGGLAIYGAIIAGVIFIYFYTKKKNISFINTLDLFAPSLIIAQCIGRWGNFINQEAYGPVTTLVNLQNLHIPNFIIQEMNINGSYHHPTFFYESLWCFIGFLILMAVRYFTKQKKVGTLTSLYLIWYGIGRYLIEGLRTDSLYFLNFRVSQIVSIILIIIGITIPVITYLKPKKKEVE